MNLTRAPNLFIVVDTSHIKANDKSQFIKLILHQETKINTGETQNNHLEEVYNLREYKNVKTNGV